LRGRHCPRRDPSLPACCSSRGSPLLRSPRIPAAPRSLSPVAYTRRAALTQAAQTGLSCSVRLRIRVLRSIPRRDLRHVRLLTRASQTWPAPGHERLGSRVVNLTRLQTSRDVAARGLAPSVEAFDTPLGPRESPRVAGVCYSALRCLPRRDLHPLESNDKTVALARSRRHDATCMHYMHTRPKVNSCSGSVDSEFVGPTCAMSRGAPGSVSRRRLHREVSRT
jgi:hypothetical protein